MKLYHGSNVEVIKPMILSSARALDFGAGFYLTSSIEQARKWAKLTVKRRKSGDAIVSVFEINENDLNDCSILYFDSANTAWLKYVSLNRSGKAEKDDYDIIIGPVANDTTMPVLNLYLKGSYNEEEALRRLLPQKLKDQYLFKTQKSLMKLHFCEVTRV